MNKPTPLDKTKIDLHVVAKEIDETGQSTLQGAEAIEEWLVSELDDIYIFDSYEEGFDGWSTDDYCRAMTQNNFEPYAHKTTNYIVMHDYA